MNNLYVKSVYVDKEIDNDKFYKNIPAIKNLENNPLVLDSNISFFIGENGSGKSTLLEAIAIYLGFSQEGGTKNFLYDENKQDDLAKYLTIERNNYAKDGFFLRSESFYNFASALDETGYIKSYGGVSLHDMSHGESFIALVKNRFKGNGIYLLDEPESALSVNKLMHLIVYIDELLKNNSQFIIATHSPILMAYPNASVYLFSEKGIEKVNYFETDYYKINKDFINKPEIMYRHLLQDE